MLAVVTVTRNLARTETVEEMLDKDIETVSVDSLLKAQAATGEQFLELILGDTVQQRDLLGDLVDRLIKGWEAALGVGGGLEVETDDTDAIAELLHVLSGAGHAIVVVEITERAEHAHSGASAEGNNESLLFRVLDIKDLDDGTSSGNGKGDDVLVDLHGVLGSLGQEHAVSNDLQTGLVRRGIGVHELALVHEVASQSGLGWSAAI